MDVVINFSHVHHNFDTPCFCDLVDRLFHYHFKIYIWTGNVKSHFFGVLVYDKINTILYMHTCTRI